MVQLNIYNKTYWTFLQILSDHVFKILSITGNNSVNKFNQDMIVKLHFWATANFCISRVKFSHHFDNQYCIY